MHLHIHQHLHIRIYIQILILTPTQKLILILIPIPILILILILKQGMYEHCDEDGDLELSGYANEVHGVLHLLSRKHMILLDQFEGGYERKICSVITNLLIHIDTYIKYINTYIHT